VPEPGCRIEKLFVTCVPVAYYSSRYPWYLGIKELEQMAYLEDCKREGCLRQGISTSMLQRVFEAIEGKGIQGIHRLGLERK
jgi:hypothetical protein